MKTILLTVPATLLALSSHAQQSSGTELSPLERSTIVTAVPAPAHPDTLAYPALERQNGLFLRMFPVPTTGPVTADCPQGILRIEVRDKNGMLVLRNIHLNGDRQFTFEIERPGIYMVDVLDRRGQWQRARFIRR